eukprot:6174222-Prorocentrum_lima.AAC.1
MDPFERPDVERGSNGPTTTQRWFGYAEIRLDLGAVGVAMAGISMEASSARLPSLTSRAPLLLGRR